jgi:polar amino acid transport system permease protein
MTASEIPAFLWAWTPYLAVGFLWNIIVSLAAMAVGTALGLPLAFARAGGHAGLRRAASLATHIARNIPTFVFLFYLAFLIPVEVVHDGRVIAIPAWIKAALALAIAVVGFVSDTFLATIDSWRRHDRVAALLFVPSWTIYFVIIVMASSTASVIGVPEIVARANIVIAASGDDSLMIWVYLYAMLWFLLFCLPLTVLMRLLRQRLERGALALRGAA